MHGPSSIPRPESEMRVAQLVGQHHIITKMEIAIILGHIAIPHQAVVMRRTINTNKAVRRNCNELRIESK